MIVYRLVCDQDHEFESWFPDSAAYDTQAVKGQVACPVCDSRKIRKAPMAPRIGKGRSETAAVEMKAALRRLRDEVEKNCEPVGDRFADEARKIHYGEAEKRSIYGQATADEARELTEEGVDFGVIPWARREDA